MPSLQRLSRSHQLNMASELDPIATTMRHFLNWMPDHTLRPTTVCTAHRSKQYLFHTMLAVLASKRQSPRELLCGRHSGRIRSQLLICKFQRKSKCARYYSTPLQLFPLYMVCALRFTASLPSKVICHTRPQTLIRQEIQPFLRPPASWSECQLG